MINWKEIKSESKEKIKNNKWNIWKPLLVIWVILTAISIIANFGNITTGMEYGALNRTPTMFGFIFDIATSLIGAILGVGYINYLLKFVRKGETEIDNVFTCLKKLWLPIITVAILVYIFTVLWTLLFIIPGIIAAISYSMSYYVLVDNENLEPLEVIKKSKQLMKGHKLDYFLFTLSFFGWALLSVLTFGILFIWVLPYMEVSLTLYYEKLKEIAHE